MYHVPLAVQCIYGCSNEGGEQRDGKEGSEIHGRWEEWRLLGLLYTDDLVLHGESEENLRVIVRCFAKVC